VSLALRLVVAAVFAASAALKAADFDATAALFAAQLPQAGEVGARALLALLILVEVALAAALALRVGPERKVLLGTLGLLAAFSATAGVMWAAGAENCGCFGTRFAFGPGATLAKNAVLMGMVALLYRRAGEGHTLRSPLLEG
jgi:hypothetical protein